MVIATQNPIEHQGTYPLPESQLDRFLMKLSVGYPGRDDELEVLDARAATTPSAQLAPVVGPADHVEAMADCARRVHVGASLDRLPDRPRRGDPSAPATSRSACRPAPCSACSGRSGSGPPVEGRGYATAGRREGRRPACVLAPPADRQPGGADPGHRLRSTCCARSLASDAGAHARSPGVTDGSDPADGVERAARLVARSSLRGSVALARARGALRRRPRPRSRSLGWPPSWSGGPRASDLEVSRDVRPQRVPGRRRRAGSSCSIRNRAHARHRPVLIARATPSVTASGRGSAWPRCAPAQTRTSRYRLAGPPSRHRHRSGR